MTDNNEVRNTDFEILKGDLNLLGIALRRVAVDLWILLRNVCSLNKKIECKYFGWLKWLVAAFAVLLLAVWIFKGCTDGETHESSEDAVDDIFQYVPRVERPEVAHKISRLNYKREFNDLNDKQLKAARKIGIAPIKSREMAENATRELVETNDEKAYVVDKLTHSIPYLVPEAAALLTDIGLAFQDSLVMKHMPQHKIIVTSVLRTRDDIKRLRRGNVNSSENSAHCHATTFDITYKRFLSRDGETQTDAVRLKAVLGEVLRDLRKQGRCYVKHEVKQACFHVTVR